MSKRPDSWKLTAMRVGGPASVTGGGPRRDNAGRAVRPRGQQPNKPMDLTTSACDAWPPLRVGNAGHRHGVIWYEKGVLSA